MASYTVERVVSQEEWNGDRGAMVTYELLFEGHQQTVSLNQLAKTPPPTQGMVLEGHIEDGPKGRKFVKDKGSYSGGGGGGKTYERQPDHPIQMARALHTSALSTAVGSSGLINQMLALGLIEKPKDKDEYKRLVESVATWVMSTYPQAVLDVAAKADG